MSRATPLPAAERREAILDAVLPLVLAHGRDVSTRRIAEASGIAEGTIFRVFDSKSTLIDAAIHRALAPGALHATLAALPPASGLRERVIQLVGALTDHVRDTHRLIALLPAPEASDRHHGLDATTRREHTERTMAALGEALGPHAADLSVAPKAAAGAILALSFGATFASTPVTPSAVADLLLNGIARSDTEA